MNRSSKNETSLPISFFWENQLRRIGTEEVFRAADILGEVSMATFTDESPICGQCPGDRVLASDIESNKSRLALPKRYRTFTPSS